MSQPSFGRGRLAATIAGVGILSMVLGAMFWGNLFTFVTGEYPNAGVGFGQQFGLKVDTTTLITTPNPEKLTGQVVPAAQWMVLRMWQLTGKMWAESDGTWTVFWTRHAGVLMNGGKDWLEDQISDSPSTTPAAYIALSRSSHTPTATDQRLWSEIDTGGGLDRTGGTYASTGVGTWTVSYQFTADAGYTNVQCTSLNYSDTDASNGTILCADTFTAVTLASGDKITITWTCSVT